jgi:hypothetical protein
VNSARGLLTAEDVMRAVRETGLTLDLSADFETSAERLNAAIWQYVDRDLSLPAKERFLANVEGSSTRWRRAAAKADKHRQAQALRELRLLMRQPHATRFFSSATIDSALCDPPSVKAIDDLRSEACELGKRVVREQHRAVGDDGWPKYDGKKLRGRPHEPEWRRLAETLLDEVWVHHSGREPTVTVDASRRPARRTSSAADFGARLLEIMADHAPDAPASADLRDQAPRLLAFIEERRRQRRR